MEARKHLDAKPVEEAAVPRIFVSYRPAELVVIDGEPQFAPIPGTRLLEITNTESDLFLNQGDRYFYFLTSGRWFRTTSAEGPWEAATLELPEEFSKIPQDHPKARVLASVKGTQEADEAVLLASIPHTATLDRSKAEAEVSYAGEPQLQQIPETTVSYVANTPQDVFFVRGRYFLCEQGVWFVADAAEGPWSLSDKVPAEIYSIPPDSQKHHVTYVQVYNSTPTTVTCGHTSGYTGVYLAAGLAVW
ncbi:MAG: hypothetical protein GY953_33770, partial [bacterium]|nr:hypothetical protein [bacterium]